MLAITIFESVGGLKSRHVFPFGRALADGTRLGEEFYILHTIYAQLPASSIGVIMASSKVSRQGHLTWIGIYGPSPPRRRTRESDYFGVGVWLKNTVVSGASLVKFLDEIYVRLRTLQASLDRGVSLLECDNERLGISDAKFGPGIFNERPKQSALGLTSGEDESICFLTVGEGKDVLQFADAIDLLQSDRRANAFNRAIIVGDPLIQETIGPLVLPFAGATSVERSEQRAATASKSRAQSEDEESFSNERELRLAQTGEAIASSQVLRRLGEINKRLIWNSVAISLFLLANAVLTVSIGWRLWSDTQKAQTTLAQQMDTIVSMQKSLNLRRSSGSDDVLGSRDNLPSSDKLATGVISCATRVSSDATPEISTPQMILNYFQFGSAKKTENEICLNDIVAASYYDQYMLYLAGKKDYNIEIYLNALREFYVGQIASIPDKDVQRK